MIYLASWVGEVAESTKCVAQKLEKNVQKRARFLESTLLGILCLQLTTFVRVLANLVTLLAQLNYYHHYDTVFLFINSTKKMKAPYHIYQHQP